MPCFDVCGIGNAIVDMIADCNDAFLAEHGITKGSMTLVDAERSRFLQSKLVNPVCASGGSVANSMAGIASLGGKPAYLGKVGKDSLGKLFEDDMKNTGVHFSGMPSNTDATGACMIFVTPDAQRSMNTFLGAATSFGKADLDETIIQNAKITYLEGYLLDSPSAEDAFYQAAKIAHKAGKKLALSLSDSFCVRRYPEKFLALVKNEIDVLFCNEDELCALYKTQDFDEAVAQIRNDCALTAVTRGSEGSLIVSKDHILSNDVHPIGKLVDTTGAGDLFAAGFLFGLTQEMRMEDCGRIASIAAAEVICHYGPRPLIELKNLI